MFQIIIIKNVKYKYKKENQYLKSLLDIVRDLLTTSKQKTYLGCITIRKCKLFKLSKKIT